MPAIPEALLQLRHYDRDRYLTALLAPRRERDALLTLLAFCTELARAHVVAREPMLAAIRLTWWREAVEEIYAKRPVRQHPLVVALAEAIATHALPQAAFAALIQVHFQDLEPVPCADEAALIAYCRATTLPLLQLAARIAETPDDAPMLEPLALAFGLMAQLRMVAHEARAGRCFFPPSLLRQHGLLHNAFADAGAMHIAITEGDNAMFSTLAQALRDSEKTGATQAFARAIANHAEQLLTRAAALSLSTSLPEFVRLQGVLTRHMLGQLARADYALTSPRFTAPAPWLPIRLLLA